MDRNVLTVMSTGSGKSFCFRVSALVIDGLTVMVAPMKDQMAALRLAGVVGDGFHSGNAREDNAAAGETRAAATGRPGIAVIRADEMVIAVRGAASVTTARAARSGRRRLPRPVARWGDPVVTVR